MVQALEKIQGHAYTGDVFVIGQPVLGIIPEAPEQPKLQSWCLEGIWLGDAVESNVHILGAAEGVVLTHAVKPMADRNEIIYERTDWTP